MLIVALCVLKILIKILVVILVLFIVKNVDLILINEFIDVNIKCSSYKMFFVYIKRIS